MAAFNLRSALTRLLTAAEADANISALALQSQNFYIPTAANQDYIVAVKMPFGGTITETATKATSGTSTAQLKVNALALGLANAASSALNAQTQVTNNTFVAGDSLVLTISANAACLGLSLAIKFQRNLD